MSWASGRGYVASWKHVHRAEEAMLIVADPSRLAAEASTDTLRLKGSRISNRDELSTDHEKLARKLERDGHTPTLLERWGARRTRRALNEYTDTRAGELVRLRARTLTLQVTLGVATFLILSLAILATQRIGLIESFVAYFLVGAVAGLLQTAFVEQRRRRAVEDFGVSRARLTLSPLLSGIAAIAGVLLVGLLGGHPLGLDLIADTMNDTTLEFAKLTAPHYPAAFVVAAVFGLTPELLLSRLRAIGDQLQFDIDAAEATESKAGQE